ncbi:MAG: TonB-dependent receptor [Thermoanaerobaculia bacterium]|nr:TonB-dependent receptor [Thermoanaerobaculia bacterium]
MRKSLWLSLIAIMVSLPALAQQTGSLSGTVTLTSGEALPGVTVEASSNVLPRPRATSTGVDGDYRLPLLPPGTYQISFTIDSMPTVTRTADVFLQQNTAINIIMGSDIVEDTIMVIGSAPVIDISSSEIKTAVGHETIASLPVGQQYRDLVKLIPGVQYTEDSVRGPSAGGSGQDNVYQFDGVNVNLPLFGTLSSEPSSHDIDQISIVKGGATAIDFNRAGGFTINSVSKSGTNTYHGGLSYQIQTAGMTGDQDTESSSEFDEDRDWAVANFGGPILKDNLFFYTSYYRPTRSRSNSSNAYGSVDDFNDERDELFGKLTFTPTERLLIGASYRDSDREVTGRGVSSFETASRALGDTVGQEIAIVEGSWVLTNDSFLSFKVTDYSNENSSRPDVLFDFPIAVGAGGTVLDVANLDTQGSVEVPTLASCGGDPTCLAFVTPLINRYGYSDNGVPTGGGFVGAAGQIDDGNYYRESYQIGYDHLFGSDVTHEIHAGYQWYQDDEELLRTSNGWGSIDVIGGIPSSDLPAGTFFQATVQQAGTVGFPAGVIKSSFESQNFEINDKIKWNNWSLNLGLVFSNDELFGQGLRESSSTPSGFVLDETSTYRMYEVPFEDMIQPRIGLAWAYNGKDTLYTNFARYNPAASSLPRAASWARNSQNQVLEVFFDQNGNQIDSRQLGSSSGKFFQPNMNPRTTDEFLIGTARQLNNRWTGRAHARYRRSYNFWEDTNNTARSSFDAPAGFPQEDYIPELNDYRFGPDGIGGSSYVIAELDQAFTKYYEVNLEAEYNSSNAYLRASYVWSHYYGNFDQDNSTTNNDQNIFIGSSNIADGAGRQIWNDKYGDLHGDRRHQLKVYGYYRFNWNGSAGLYAIYQSGQPWEAWNVEVYREYTGSQSDTIRFAEPAGSRSSDDHYQMDFNYTQNINVGDRIRFQLVADVFNVFDKQTGYNNNSDQRESTFGEPQSYFDPRRLQLAVKFDF